MSFIDALMGTAPDIQMSNQAKAYSGGTQLDFANPYGAGIGADAAMRQRQNAFLAALNQQAQGRGPAVDLAQAQFQQNLNQGNAALASQIASARGLNPAAALRMAAQQGAAVNQGAASQAAMLRAQQQLGALGQMGASLGQFRGQEQALAGLGATGNQAQNALNAQNFNAAQNLNANIGMQQAGMQQAANQNSLQAWGGIANGLGGGITKLAGLAHGGMIDSPANDIVPKMLSPGEVVIPRSIAQGPDAPSHAAAFMQGVLAQEQARAKALHGHFGFADGGPVEPPEFDPRVYQAAAEGTVNPTGLPTEAAMRRGTGYPSPPKPATSYPTSDSEYQAQRQQYLAEQAKAGDKVASDKLQSDLETASATMKQAQYDWYQKGGPKPSASLLDYMPKDVSASPIASDVGAMAPMKPEFKAQALTGQVPNSPNPPAQEPAGRVPGAAPTDIPVTSTDRQARLAQGFEAGSESPVERAVRENSEIEARTAEKTAQTYENQIAQRDAAVAQRKQEVEKNLADYKRISETVPNPNKWWSEQSTGGKIATGIGLVLSSLGSGIAGQPNMAMQVIDDAIKRDITLQQSKKDSLLAHFEREGKTREEAFALSQSVALQKTADQMQALAARATSQQAANNLVLMSRQMAMQAQQLQMSIAEKSAEIGLKRAEAYKAGSEAQKTGMEARKMGLEMGALKALTSGQPTDRQTLNWLPSEYRERVAEVTLPDGKRHMGLVATPKMREELDTQSVAYNNFRDIWKEATDFARQHPGGELPSDAAIKGDEIKNNLIMRLAEVNKAKFSNLSQTDQKMIEDLTANLSKVVDWRNNMRNLNDMKARVDRAWRNDLEQAFGVKPATPSAARKYE